MSAIDEERRTLDRAAKLGDARAALRLSLLRLRVGGDRVAFLGRTSTHLLFLFVDKVQFHAIEPAAKRSVLWTKSTKKALADAIGRPAVARMKAAEFVDADWKGDPYAWERLA